MTRRDFDYDSLHRQFKELTDQFPKMAKALNLARADLTNFVRGMEAPNEASKAASVLLDAQKNVVFVGELTHVRALRVVDQPPEPYVEAALIGVQGLGPHDAYVLADSIITSWEGEHEFNPDTWMLFSFDSLKRKLGDANQALIIMEALGGAQPNLLESLITNRPAVEDKRPGVVVRAATASLKKTEWHALDYQPLVNLHVAPRSDAEPETLPMPSPVAILNGTSAWAKERREISEPFRYSPFAMNNHNLQMQAQQQMINRMQQELMNSFARPMLINQLQGLGQIDSHAADALKYMQQAQNALPPQLPPPGIAAPPPKRPSMSEIVKQYMAGDKIPDFNDLFKKDPFS